MSDHLPKEIRKLLERPLHQAFLDGDITYEEYLKAIEVVRQGRDMLEILESEEVL